MPSTCFETEGSSSGRMLYKQLWYGTFYMKQNKQFDVQVTVYLDKFL